MDTPAPVGDARNAPYAAFRRAVHRLSGEWQTAGLPSSHALYAAFDRLIRLRSQLNIPGIWQRPPSMITATVDDGLGQGLNIIEASARAVGIRLTSLGLLQPPEAIIRSCRRRRPDLLGLTVLQFDSEDDLAFISARLPEKTRIVAGGPVFAGDPEFAHRTGVDYAENVAAFLKYLLALSGHRDVHAG